eukprot:TRINITY_DN3796_c0_g3_i1.p1 TRINITY_DN3796_c0_g3~~TRINITY_DN3796_c0_g3_i1.p1  ORF type:complete len:150 (-),score=39.29 TRINITY_DN3796_c0_g3_i1:532-918(-)
MDFTYLVDSLQILTCIIPLCKPLIQKYYINFFKKPNSYCQFITAIPIIENYIISKEKEKQNENEKEQIEKAQKFIQRLLNREIVVKTTFEFYKNLTNLKSQKEIEFYLLDSVDQKKRIFTNFSFICCF